MHEDYHDGDGNRLEDMTDAAAAYDAAYDEVAVRGDFAVSVGTAPSATATLLFEQHLLLKQKN